MLKFCTTYKVRDPEKTKGFARYSSYIWAKNRREARGKCKYRGLCEQISGTFVKAKAENAKVALLGHEHLPHWICFLGFVALKAGYSPEEIFGDRGVLHELIHANDGAYSDEEDRAIERRYLLLCKDLGFLP